MKVAICMTDDEVTNRWMDYLKTAGIQLKIVDFYDSEIVLNVADCDALLWHFHQGNPKDQIFARQLLYSLQTSGMRVFPDFHTSWHFDDKVGQKYLLESIGAPLVPTRVFYNKNDALAWIKNTDLPIVSKLRGGAGSQNVKLIKSRYEAKRLINKSFGRGFLTYNPMASLKERLRKYREGNKDFRNVIEGFVRFIIPPKYSKIKGRERGYVYFQEFIPGNDHDIRVVVIGDKAFALKRMVRKNDFRASGSGKILYERTHIQDDVISLSFSIADKLKTQCVAFDYIYKKGQPLITEISYGFSPQPYDKCPGYWDKSLRWHEGKFNPYSWMVEDLINNVKDNK